MSKFLMNRKTAVIAVAAAAVFAGGAAFAYPPMNHLTVSATGAPSTDPSHPNTIDVKVTVMNAISTCSTRVKLDDGSEILIPAGGTTLTTDFFLPPTTSGRHTVRARTVDCKKGQKQHASSRFLIIGNAKATASGPAQVERNYRIDVSGIPEGATVTALAIKPNSSDTATATSPPADRRGTTTIRIKFPSTDPNWSVSFSTSNPAGIPIAPLTVTVNPR